MQGNLEYIEKNDEAQLKERGGIHSLAALLSVDETNAEKALCSRVVAAKGEVMEKGHTLEQARYGRDALAKVGSNLH